MKEVILRVNMLISHPVSVYRAAKPNILEPIMDVSVVVPVEFQSTVVSNLNKRKGVINDSEVQGDTASFEVTVPLNNMFSYSSDLRAATQGKGEFSMEYRQVSWHLPEC